MDGQRALYELRQLLQEDSGSGFLDDFSSYGWLNEAASEIAWDSKSTRTTQTITTSAAQASYDLNPDYLGLYLQNRSKNYYIQYNDGTNNTFINWKPYEEIVYGDRGQESASIPNHFTVIDNPTMPSQITGKATSAGAASGGSSTLTSTTGDFSNAYMHDTVHNTTDGSMGVVISKTSSTVITTALFGGTDDDWTSSDSYVIQPQPRFQLVFDPKPSTASHTVTVSYIQRPPPVFHSYGVFRLPQVVVPSIVKRAAWMYKYRDREPDYGDKWYAHSQACINRYLNQADHMLRRKRFTVNLKARR